MTSPTDPFTGTFKVTGGTTEALSYSYDGHGNQNSTTQGTAGSGGPTWTKTYNLLGQITTQTDPDTGTATGMTYDGAGNLVQATNARGKTVSYTYDALARKTGKFASTVAGQQAGAAGNQTAAWVYDNSNNVANVTHAVGQLTTAVSYSGGNTYTSQQLNFNVFGESLGTSVTIPAGEGSLAGTYTVRHTYTANTGLALKDIYIAQGGLPAETVLHTYQGLLDLPQGIGGLTGYAQTTTYDAYTRVNQAQIGASPNQAYITNTYDDNSGRITDQLVTRATGSTANVDEQAYTYDPAGNLTTQTSTHLGSATNSETQCFRYDGLDQLVAAWTANDQCATTPSTGNSSMVADNLGASSAYWTTWSIDTQSDRTSQIRHGFTGGPSADTTTTYGYGTSGAQPHTLTSTTTTGASSGTTTYGYDTDGNMTTRNAGQGNQTLTYDDTGQLSTISGSTTGSSSFVYGTDGGLLQKDPNTSTLYLGSQQFVLNISTNAVTGTRYYPLPGGGQAIRTGTATTAVVFALPDRHGTPTLYLDYTAQTPTWRQYTPYGDTRSTAVTAPDNRGFLNKPTDQATGLTLLGARQYDPTIGRFITADPLLETTDPTQINGYAYAGNNPVVHADPTGLSIARESTNSTSCWEACQELATALYHNRPIQGATSGSARPSDSGSEGWEVPARYSTLCGRGGCNRVRDSDKLSCGRGGCSWSVHTTAATGGCHATCNHLCVEDANNDCLKSGLWDGAMIVTTAFDAAVDVALLVQPEFEGPAIGAEMAGLKAEADQAEAADMAAAAAKGDDGWTRVGRWMSPDELRGMRDTGNVQWNNQGTHRVASPPAPDTYRVAPPGDVYAEYDVPTRAAVLRDLIYGTAACRTLSARVGAATA